MSSRTILITGCSSGIGYATAHGLAKAGWRVFATCRHEADAEKLRAEGLESLRLDYADPDNIRAALGKVLSQTGGTLDALFNNGAFALPGAVEDLPRDGLREIFETNLFGVHDLTKEVIPVMRRQGHGRIINNSSVLGLVPIRWRGAYTATKHAMEGLTLTMRMELNGTGIYPVLIEPGPVTSKIRANSIPHFERWIDWQHSALAGEYQKSLLKRLYEDRGKDRFELPAEAVTPVLLRILAARAPRPRYFITKPTYFAEAMRRTLPSSWLERVLRRA